MATRAQQTSDIARVDGKHAAVASLAARGVVVFVWGAAFGLRRDRRAPHGWRVVARAPTVAALVRKVEQQEAGR